MMKERIVADTVVFVAAFVMMGAVGIAAAISMGPAGAQKISRAPEATLIVHLTSKPEPVWGSFQTKADCEAVKAEIIEGYSEIIRKASCVSSPTKGLPQ